MAYVCENNRYATDQFEEGYLSCTDDKVLLILDAIYGKIDAGSQCTNEKSSQANRVCDSRIGFNKYFGTLPFHNFTFTKIKFINQVNSKDLTTFARQKCDWKQSCQFKGSNKLLGDPCSGVLKYTRIRFFCRNGESLKSNPDQFASKMVPYLDGRYKLESVNIMGAVFIGSVPELVSIGSAYRTSQVKHFLFFQS